MPDESALELDTRRRIYHHVEDNPGTHMREVGRELDIPMGTLEYHLRYLVDEDLLATREDDRYTRYFVKGQTSRQEKDVLAAIRQETPRRIVAHLLMEPGSSHGQILEEFDVSASTLSFHLGKLVDAGVVEKEKSGRKNLYTVADEEVASRVLIQYRESFVDDVVDRFAEVWMDLDAGLQGPAAAEPGARAAADDEATEPSPEGEAEEADDEATEPSPEGEAEEAGDEAAETGKAEAGGGSGGDGSEGKTDGRADGDDENSESKADHDGDEKQADGEPEASPDDGSDDTS